MRYANGYDFDVAYIDNGTQWKKQMDKNAAIQDEFKKLSPSDKKESYKLLVKRFGEKQIEGIFKL
jgi:hypothetical protein